MTRMSVRARSAQRGGSATKSMSPKHVTRRAPVDRPMSNHNCSCRDVNATPEIHRALKDKELFPTMHVVDTGYTEAKGFAATKKNMASTFSVPHMRITNGKPHKKQGLLRRISPSIGMPSRRHVPPAQPVQLDALPQIATPMLSSKYGSPCADCMRCPSRPQCTKATRRRMYRTTPGRV